MSDEIAKEIAKYIAYMILDDIKAKAVKKGAHKGFIKVDKVEKIIKEYFGDN